MAPFVNPLNLVFTGNYMNPQSPVLGVESLLYLLCYKLLMPNRIVMLRGELDFRGQLEGKPVHTDCVKNYGQPIWDLLMDIYDQLPYVAIVDGRIVVCRSGIPSTVSKPLRQLEPFREGTVKKPLANLDNSPTLWSFV